MLASREDVFPGYTQGAFEDAFQQHFEMRAREPIAGSERVLYEFRRP